MFPLVPPGGEITPAGPQPPASPTGSSMRDLRDFLLEADLGEYHAHLGARLKVTTIEHLKYVREEDLEEIGMTRPEMRRLKKFYRKEFPSGAIGKLRKVTARFDLLYPFCFHCVMFFFFFFFINACVSMSTLLKNNNKTASSNSNNNNNNNNIKYMHCSKTTPACVAAQHCTSCVVCVLAGDRRQCSYM